MSYLFNTLVSPQPPDAYKKALSLLSPVSGTIQAIQQASHNAFAHRLLGEGCVVLLSGHQIIAPDNALVMQTTPGHYHLRIKTRLGLTINIQVGMPEQNLHGERCHMLVKAGQKVTAGTVLMEVDPMWLKTKNALACAVTLMNVSKLTAMSVSPLKQVMANQDTLFTLYV